MADTDVISEQAMDEMMIESAGGSPVPAAELAQPSLRSRAIRGSIWTMLGYGLSQIFRLGSNLILTRMLFPAVYGEMAIVSIFFQGLQMFSDVGIGPSIIQNQRGEDQNFLNTAWTMQVIRGFVISLCTAIVAWPVARIYGQPDLLYVLPIVGLTAVIGGFNSTALFTLSRRIYLGKLTLLELGTQVASITAMIVWAIFSRTVWALVAGNIVASVLRMVVSHYLIAGPKNRLQWDKESSRVLIKFGRWVFISTVLTFFAGEADRMIFGVRIPIAALGIYSIANMLADLPKQAIIRIAGPVTFSIYSQLGKEQSKNSFASMFTQIRFPILVFGAVAVTGLFLVGPLMINVMYDSRYSSAGWMLQILVATAWFEILETTNGSAVLALGRPGWIATANAAKLIGLVTLIPLGAFVGRLYGSEFYGMLIGLLLSEMVRYISSAIGIKRQGFGSFSQDAKITFIAVLITAGAVYLEHALRLVLQPVWLPTLISSVALCLAWIPLAWRAYDAVRSPVKRERVVERDPELVAAEMAVG